MTDTRKVMQQALEALEILTDGYDDNTVGLEIDAIYALREALAQQGEQQPWRKGYDEGYTAGRMRSEMIGQEAKAYKEAYFKLLEQVASLKALEPAPPIILQAAPAAQPLTDEQIYEMYNEPRSDAEMLEFARAIERHHGIGADK